jgi:hypothetical protein
MSVGLSRDKAKQGKRVSAAVNPWASGIKRRVESAPFQFLLSIFQKYTDAVKIVYRAMSLLKSFSKKYNMSPERSSPVLPLRKVRLSMRATLFLVLCISWCSSH